MRIKKGQCNQCGKCCEVYNMILKKHGKCSALKIEDGKAYCEVYKNRPDGCRRYPDPRGDVILIDKCGFYYEERD